MTLMAFLVQLEYLLRISFVKESKYLLASEQMHYSIVLLLLRAVFFEQLRTVEQTDAPLGESVVRVSIHHTASYLSSIYLLSTLFHIFVFLIYLIFNV